MSRKRVSFSYDNPPTTLLHYLDVNEDSTGGESECRANKKKGNFVLRVPKCSKLSSPVRFLRFLRSKVARVLFCVPVRSRRRRSSGKINSASNLTRSRSLAESVESHRAEAIDDCIEFLNSSHLQRSSFSISSTY